MRIRLTGGVLALIVLCAADAPAPLKSGPQVGTRISKPFEVQVCNGPDTGDMVCLV